MELLRTISIFWSLLHTLVLFFLLFESRYPKKKTMIVTAATMLPLIAVNLVLSIATDPDTMGTAMLFTLSLPSLIVFWILAKHRDGRFFFTFCLADTVSLEIIYITMILNHYITPDTNILMFALRLFAYPLLEFLVYKRVRTSYLAVQRQTKQGWGMFAVVSALFYVLMSLAATYPTQVIERPEYLPEVLLLLLLIPVIYTNIILTLRRQQKFHELTEQENILRLQVQNMSTRIEELTAADDRFREERHNYRHKMKAIASLVATKQYDELAALVADYNEAYRRTQVIRYCRSAVIDAVLSTYIKNAQNKGIRVDVGFAFPDPIPVNETELATVFANAIENAIHACEKLPQSKRYIDIKVLDRPRFMIRIANSFDGNAEFDENGIPVNHEEGHGFGTRSIAAFCKIHGAHYIFKADGEKFTLFLNF